jgi:hypothetical protein
MWHGSKVWANPSEVLATAHERFDIVEGLIPDRGITWLYGASMSFKTFVAMSIAAAASTGSDWMGRKTEECLVVYVGAEGGMSLHARRAGAELAAGAVGSLCVATERPALDTRLGQIRLRGILEGLQPSVFGSEGYDDLEEDAVFAGAVGAYSPDADVGFDDAQAILVIIDTYSQTSGGDDKSNVSAYIKGLRDMIDDTFWRLSFLVVDHATKAGGSYMGSVAKLNDVDSQIEVVRNGQTNRATLYHRKVKDGLESEPVSVEMVPKVLGDYVDAYGKPISTLVVRDGSKAAKIAEVADGKAGVILTLLEDEGGRCDDETLRKLFAAHRSNDGIKAESVTRAYKRGKENLQDAALIAIEGEMVIAV